MPPRTLRLPALVVALLAALVVPAAPAVAADSSDPVHRVVWDEWKRDRKGVHLRSALEDGSDRRRVYDLAAGFVMYLSLDREGRRVAFNVCCRDDSPLLVVANVMTGKVLEPLAGNRRIYAVGGIGWSPNGRRLVFEGWNGEPPHHHKSLWTVRPDGSRLRKILDHPGGRFEENEALAWTPDGILYSTGRRLVSLSGGEEHLVMRRVISVRISGDGHHIVTTRMAKDGSRTVWVSAPDGSDRQRVIGPYSSSLDGDTWWSEVVPNHDATRLLAWRDEGEGASAIVSWEVTAGSDTATELDFASAGSAATWN